VGYGEVEETGALLTTESNWTDGTVPSRAGTHDLAASGPTCWPRFVPACRCSSRTWSATRGRTRPRRLAAFDAIDTRAAITASLVKDGRMRAALYVHAARRDPGPKRDAELVTEVPSAPGRLSNVCEPRERSGPARHGCARARPASEPCLSSRQW
jgi:hypothetical protein